MNTYFILILIAIGLGIAIFGFDYFHKLRNKDQGKEPEAFEDPSEEEVEVPNLDEIHQILRFGSEKVDIVEEEVPLIDGTMEIVKTKQKVIVPPQYYFTEKSIRLVFDPTAGPADINYLIKKAQIYSQILYEKQITNVPRLWPVVDPVKDNEVDFLFVEDDMADELEIQNVLKNSQTHYKNIDGSFSYPKVYRDGDDLMFDTSSCPIGVEAIEKSAPHFGATFNKNYKFVNREGETLFRMIDLKPRADRVFPFKTKVFGQKEKLMDLINRGREFAKQKKMEVMLVGEIEDPVIQLPTQVFSTINDFVHGVVVGQTGSGKSTTLLSNIFINALINKELFGAEDIYYFADGKSGGDYDLVAKYLSDYPVAQKSSGSDPMIELANIFSLIWAEYMRRQRIFREAREAGKLVRNIFEYREQVGPLPRVWVIVDEFKAFLGDMEFETLTNSQGSIPNMLVRLFAEARSFGFTFIFASQRYQMDSFPTVLRTNLPTRFAHNLPASDLGVLQMDSMPVLEKGGYMLKLEGLNCPRTNSSQIQCRMPYLGSTEEFKALLDEHFTEKKHKPFDYDLIYNKGQAQNFDRMTIKEKWLLIKKLFIQEQGFTIKQYAQDHYIDSMDISSKLSHPDFPNGIGFGLLDKNDSIDEFLSKRNKKQIESMGCDLYVFFMEGDFGRGEEQNVKDWKKKGIYPKNFCFIQNSLYRRPLKKAMADYEEKRPNTFFYDLMVDLMYDYEADETEEKENKESKREKEFSKVPANNQQKTPTVEDLIVELQEEELAWEESIEKKLAQWENTRAKPKEVEVMKASDPELFEIEVLDDSEEENQGD